MSSRFEPRLTSGSLLDFYSQQWGPIYQAVLSILGPTGLILAGGDPRHGQPGATTFTTAGVPVTFTWSAAPSGFTTPLGLTDRASFQGIIPIVTLNPAGSGEFAKAPDADLWARGDATNDGPFTFGIWINPLDATSTTMFSVWNESGGGLIRQWRVFFNSVDRPTLELYDESLGGFISRRPDTAIVELVFSFLVFTFAGLGTGSSSDIKMYLDGDQKTIQVANSGSYTAMEDGSAAAVLGGEDGFLGSGANRTLDAKVALGPCGPGFCHKELTANEVAAWYDVTRRPLGY